MAYEMVADPARRIPQERVDVTDWGAARTHVPESKVGCSLRLPEEVTKGPSTLAQTITLEEYQRRGEAA